MAFSFKLRRCIGCTPSDSPAPLASPTTTFQSDTPAAWISWLVDVFGVNWPVDRRTLHRPEVRCIINPTVGWPHGAHWLPMLAHFEWPIAHPVCMIASEPKTSTYIFSGPLYLLAVCTDTLVARRDDLKYSDVDYVIRKMYTWCLARFLSNFQRDILLAIRNSLLKNMIFK